MENIKTKNLVDIFVNINGNDVHIRTYPTRTLLDVLREELHLTGTKSGCEIGECGACTVIMDGKAVNSCLTLISQVNGKKIITIEGISNNGNLNPIQKAFIQEQAFQCGFCTPGFIMSSVALLGKNKKPTDEEIKQALVGNLCRCTGYSKIFKVLKNFVNKDYTEWSADE